jgi:hypothetical protein
MAAAAPSAPFSLARPLTELVALLGESQPKLVRGHDGQQAATPPAAWIRAALSLPQAA